MAERATVAVVQRLAAETLADVEALIAAATEVDGVAPVSEQGMLDLRDAGEGPIRHLVSRLDGVLAGYAQLDLGGKSSELVVAPGLRGRGVGRVLVTALASATGPDLRIWAHGDLPAAAALAASTGLVRVRSLWLMSRSLADELPEPRIPHGLVVDTFSPGADDAAWVDLNTRAFANHPEQGRLTLADLRERMAQPWFDPAGFFVARRGTRMIGFHWTKVHDDTTGEVYVVGVDPDEQGSGLGRALTLLGLHHLRGRGVAEAILYVDEDNTGAVRLYSTLGFTRRAVDVMYARSLS